MSKAKVIFLCVGNSARSQMAEGLLKSEAPEFQVFSAGTNPASRVHPFAIEVMKEVGIDISDNRPKDVREFDPEEIRDHQANFAVRPITTANSAS